MTVRGLARFLLFASIVLLCVVPPPVARPTEIPAHPIGFPERSWVDSLLATMTLEEKVGQLIMLRAPGYFLNSGSEESVRLEHYVSQDCVGGLLVTQGDVYETAMELNRLQRLARIPLLVAGDYERGVAMRVHRTTPFDDAMAIGATRDSTLAYRVGKATAEEARAIGVQQNFAPVADINNNPENPVINTRSFGDDRALVSTMVAAFVRGTNDGNAVSTVKHFPGHGGTETDSHIALPVLGFDTARIDSVELSSFRRAIDEGVRSVMVAHIGVPALDPDFNGPASFSPRVVDSLLIRRLGFKGLVVTDALEMRSVTRSYAPGEAAVLAFQAGADMLLSPADYHAAIDAIVRLVRAGVISQDRLERSVKKILALKQLVGLDQHRIVDVDRIGQEVASNEHLLLAKEIAQRSITVLRNEQHLLPLLLADDERVELIAIGDEEEARTEINRPSSPGSAEFFGEYLATQFRKRHPLLEFDRLSSASDALAINSAFLRATHANLVVVALYVKSHAGFGSVGLPVNVTKVMKEIQTLHIPIVVLALGNPYLANALPRAQAVLCSYSDAELSVEASVQALYGEIPVSGSLPVTISSTLRFGVGIRLPQEVLRPEDPFTAGFDREKLQYATDLVRAAIRDSAFPGAQLAIIKDGMLALNASFGSLTYEPSSSQITHATRYDLASLTKVIATTTAIMKLLDEGRLSLDDSVARFIPRFSGEATQRITIRQLLKHQGGLPPFRKLWETCATPGAALDTVFSTPLVAAPGDTTIYSDLGMIILGKVVERIAKMSLAEFMEKEFYRPLGMTGTGFCPPASEWGQIAPTELDTTWRRKLIQGTVHDENAALLGGISGHAGLFSSSSDLAVFMQMLMNGGTYRGVRYLNDSTVRFFTSRQGRADDRALGWDLKAPERSSAGELFSANSFGHTGFTGTSIWVDPARQLCVIFLTNRVYPTRANQKIAGVRPALHDAVVRAIIDDRLVH